MTNRQAGSTVPRFFDNPSRYQKLAASYQRSPPRHDAEHRLTIIGSGMIGREHMRVATLLGRARIHGIYDQSTTSMDVAEADFRTYASTALQRYTDLESACNDPASDALLICTPNCSHFELLQLAMGSGKPLFVEKPMATSLADAARILEFGDSYASFIQLGLQYRYKSQYVEAFHQALARSTLGTIKTISMSEYRPPFLDKVEQWNKFNANTGGTLVEKCCHYFDLINLMAASQPTRVYASGGQAVNFLDFERAGRRADIDDHAFVIIDYQNGIRANFTLNMFCHELYEEMIVTGDKGRLVAAESSSFTPGKRSRATISIEVGEAQEGEAQEGEAKVGEAQEGEAREGEAREGEQGGSRVTDVTYPEIVERSGHHGATFFEHDAFIDRLEGKPGDSASLLQGLWSMVVASAAQQSQRTNNVVNIDEFIAANKLTNISG